MVASRRLKMAVRTFAGFVSRRIKICRLAADTTSMETYLVSYEYGSGTMWGYVTAASPREVLAFLPEVDVWDHPPAWLTTRELTGLAAQPVVAVDRHNALDFLFGNFRGMNAAFAS
jgi:hypothetical protein